MRDRVFRKDRPSLDAFNTPEFLLAAIGKEVEEAKDPLSHLMFYLKYAEDPCPNTIERFRQDLGQELADILLYLLALSNHLGFDLFVEAMKKFDYNEERFKSEDFREGDGREAYQRSKLAEAAIRKKHYPRL